MYIGNAVLIVVVDSVYSFMMEYDVHTLLDALTLVATAWVIFMLRVTLKDTYQQTQDTIELYYVVCPRGLKPY